MPLPCSCLHGLHDEEPPPPHTHTLLTGGHFWQPALAFVPRKHNSRALHQCACVFVRPHVRARPCMLAWHAGLQLAGRPLDLPLLYAVVTGLGGCEAVKAQKSWRVS